MEKLISYYNSHGFEGGENTHNLELAIVRASELIDLVTGGKPTNREGLMEHQKKAVLQALCNQAEMWLMAYPETVDYSVLFGGRSYTSVNNGVQDISPLAVTALRLSGLLKVG